MTRHPVSRRSVLLSTATGASTLTLGRLLAGSPAGAATTAAASTFYKGADISWTPALESEGQYWRNSAGTREDLLTILKGYGLTAIRLRTFVHPSNDPNSGRCDINATAAMALRVQDAGMRVNIDYHFSDTWADEGHQNPPSAWKNMSYSQMLSAIASYVNSSMNVIKAKGVTPTWVQIGNEINQGICHPVGNVSNPAQMTGLLNAAHDAVKQVFPNAIIMIHLASPQKSSVASFFNAYSSHGGKWDMNGFSSYTGASDAASRVNDMKSVSDAHGKPYMQVECGGDKATVVAYLTALAKNGGQGLLFWEPEAYVWDSTTRKPTSAMDGFTASIPGLPPPPPPPSASASASASVSPSVTSSAPRGALSAIYRTVNQWSGGFQAEVTVTAGSTPINGWTVQWTLSDGQAITQLWNGTLSTIGSAVNVRNASYNGTLAANASTTFGLIATGSESIPSLTVSTP